MEIQSATAIQYSTPNNSALMAQTSQPQDQVKQTQQQNNERVSASQETSQSSSQSTDQSTDQSTSQSTSQSANQSTDQATKQGTRHTNESNTSARDKNPKQAEQALSETELKQVTELKSRDTEVRAHEAAHLATAGKYATGGASFEYKRGPDGRSYAVGGEVGIDTSPIANDPQATLRKAQQIRAAASAPANPSAQDRQVAAQASVMATEARVEISQENVEGGSDTKKSAEQNTESNTDESDSNPVSNNKSENQNNRASNEYQTVADYSEDSIKSVLELIA